MSFLRTVSTRRLLALIVAAVAVAGGGTAIAVAAGSSSPTPTAEGLAQAVHGALTAPPVTGMSADISFTNHLIATSNLGDHLSPLLAGTPTGRIWLSTDHQHLRIELQGNNGDAQLVVNGNSFWVYDPSSNTVYEGQLPATATATTHAKKSGKAAATKADVIPSIAQIQTEITSLAKHLNLSTAIPGDVGGQPTYSVQVRPQHDGGLLSSAQVAWDAINGVPLQFSVYAQGDTNPVLQLTASNISFGTIDPSSFSVPQPAGAKVVNVTVPSGSTAKSKLTHKARHAASVTGVAAVAGKVHFSLAAPATLAGLPRQSTRLLDWGGTPAALVTYGQGLGAVVVIEQTAKTTSGSGSGAGSGLGQQLALPTVSISNGVSGQELDTALGTMIRFTRSGVDYTVLGSVPPVAAEAAARGL
jgi:outer membrane lipoprotein-sorting protein